MALALALAVVAFGAQAQSGGQVYQWKDAKGVTHYSQTPPPSGKADSRLIVHKQREAPVAEGETKPETPQCGIARSNIALLESGSPLQRDTNGDGKPDKTLDDKERASQLQLARMVLEANCATAAAQP